MSTYLNPKLEVRECANPRLGKGVFAREKISRSEIIHVTEGVVLSNTEWARLPEKYQHYCYDINGTAVLCPLDFANPTIDWFINHSCDPNAGSASDIRILTAMRDIEPNEEVTMDDAMVDEDPTWHMECYCDAASCRSIITGNDWMIPELQERYQGYFQKNIQEKVDALLKRSPRS